MQITRRSGFSLIEALVVLAIGGMALAVIFSIGIKAGDTGFALGRRAMAAADQDVAVGDLRVILRSFDLRPPQLIQEGVDSPLVGTADRLQGQVVLEQATACAPQGWAGLLTLSIQPHKGGGAGLYCQVGDREVVLMTWPRERPVGFSYSTDRETWVDQFSTPTERAPLEDDLLSQTLWIRLASETAGDVIEETSSGQPDRWVRFDVQA